MKRIAMPAQERTARSRLTKIVHDRPFLQASLVTMTHTCGKASCRCARGHKHVSLYLATRVENKRKMIYVPKPLESMVRAWVGTYQESGRLSQGISAECLKAFLRKKRECSGGQGPVSGRARPAQSGAVKRKASKKTSAVRKTPGRRVKS